MVINCHMFNTSLIYRYHYTVKWQECQVFIVFYCVVLVVYYLVSGGYTLLYHIIRICQGGESVIELGSLRGV